MRRHNIVPEVAAPTLRDRLITLLGDTRDADLVLGCLDRWRYEYGNADRTRAARTALRERVGSYPAATPSEIVEVVLEAADAVEVNS